MAAVMVKPGQVRRNGGTGLPPIKSPNAPTRAACQGPRYSAANTTGTKAKPILMFHAAMDKKRDKNHVQCHQHGNDDQLLGGEFSVSEHKKTSLLSTKSTTCQNSSFPEENRENRSHVKQKNTKSPTKPGKFRVCVPDGTPLCKYPVSSGVGCDNKECSCLYYETAGCGFCIARKLFSFP